jgi:hypothetical protein
MRPLIGRKYLWDVYGGVKKELVEIQDVQESMTREIRYTDGSISPSRTEIKVRITPVEWVRWRNGQGFELIEES